VSAITRHLRADIRGLLRRHDSYLDGIMEVDGKTLSGSEARQQLEKELYAGNNFIRCCSEQECPDFDPVEHGCPGHVGGGQ
jgi:hypothetical protein